MERTFDGCSSLSASRFRRSFISALSMYLNGRVGWPSSFLPRRMRGMPTRQPLSKGRVVATSYWYFASSRARRLYRTGSRRLFAARSAAINPLKLIRPWPPKVGGGTAYPRIQSCSPRACMAARVLSSRFSSGGRPRAKGAMRWPRIENRSALEHLTPSECRRATGTTLDAEYLSAGLQVRCSVGCSS